jgi:hypothetical protein
MGSAGWHALVVRVGFDAGYEDGVHKLRTMEAWLARHHRPLALFRPDGRPRSSVVCLAVPVEQGETALAWRGLCRELGLADALVQWRIAPGCNGGAIAPRTTDFGKADDAAGE